MPGRCCSLASHVDGPERSGGGSSNIECPRRERVGWAEGEQVQRQMGHPRRGKLGVGRAGTSKVLSRYYFENTGTKSKMGLV